MSKKNEEKKCPYCDGEGNRFCFSCNGSGLNIPAIATFGFPTPCPTCGGTGRKMCTYCSGTGKDINISLKM